jgi:hypothetical protein
LRGFVRRGRPAGVALGDDNADRSSVAQQASMYSTKEYGALMFAPGFRYPQTTSGFTTVSL